MRPHTRRGGIAEDEGQEAKPSSTLPAEHVDARSFSRQRLTHPRMAWLKQKAPPRTGPDSSLEDLNAEGAASFRLKNQFGGAKRVPHNDPNVDGRKRRRHHKDDWLIACGRTPALKLQFGTWSRPCHICEHGRICRYPNHRAPWAR